MLDIETRSAGGSRSAEIEALELLGDDDVSAALAEIRGIPNSGRLGRRGGVQLPGNSGHHGFTGRNGDVARPSGRKALRDC